MDIEKIEAALKAPFEPDEIEWRVGAKSQDATKGLALPYITNRAIQNRLDNVIGFVNWKNEFMALSDKSKVCALSLRIDGEWITKCDGADDTDIEATKGGISNSMKRAAVQWGIGRYLYKLPPVWVKIKHLGGKRYKIDEVPKLPNWALPKKYETEKSWEKEQQRETLPSNIKNCIDSFAKIGVLRCELENYLHLEADMFTKQDIESLKTIYWQILKGKKQKEDFFLIEEKTERSTNTLSLEESLNG